jgi:hypothetical protein
VLGRFKKVTQDDDRFAPPRELGSEDLPLRLPEMSS